MKWWEPFCTLKCRLMKRNRKNSLAAPQTTLLDWMPDGVSYAGFYAWCHVVVDRVRVRKAYTVDSLALTIAARVLYTDWLCAIEHDVINIDHTMAKVYRHFDPQKRFGPMCSCLNVPKADFSCIASNKHQNAASYHALWSYLLYGVLEEKSCTADFFCALFI